MKSYFIPLCISCQIILSFTKIYGQETQIQYLSGTGNDHTVGWKFYCTEGRHSREWDTIPVPSHWEQHGYGTYNYGYDNDSVRGKEKGLYKHTFNVPADWKNKTIHIVFEGSMTDTDVKINGKSAGPVHQGSFYRFSYNVTHLLKFDQTNILEVMVSKCSANESVNRAERFADYWIFGGIFRPVYLMALPREHINRIAIDARADGYFGVDIYLGLIDKANELTAQIFGPEGQKPVSNLKIKLSKNDSTVRLQTHISSPILWSPEFPNLYTVKISLLNKKEIIHTTTKRFGFRTIEVRKRDGIYLNGKKIKFRGVNRHCFWPTSGRTLNKRLSIQDAQLIKDMNMNAVRNSHYPPDAHFLDACDSLGIMVLDELAGWHDAYDTQTGSILVKEMLSSNMNHPSIIMWINGNEGGHNHELLPLYDKLDIQKRPVIHAWEIFRGMDTQHYRDYDYGNGISQHGHDIVFPTEFLHGLYDGGHGAGLQDFWELMWHNPLSAGGFLWNLADEGIVRTDRNGELDTDGNHGADGVLGPYREKEGSFFTVKEVWSPVYFEHREITPAFDGTFTIENRFFFTNINQCRFTWELAKMPDPYNNDSATNITITGTILSTSIAPGHKGTLSMQLPADWQKYDVLYITAYDPHQREIFTWNWPITLPKQMAQKIISTKGVQPVSIEKNDSLYIANAEGLKISFNRNTGLLYKIENARGVISLHKGPVICEGITDFKSLSYHHELENLIIESTFGDTSSFNEVKWTIFPSGWVKLDIEYCPEEEKSTFLGISFSYPENRVEGVTWMGDGPYRVWKNRMKGTRLNVWHKDYNNTITGQRGYVYPEFQGYHSRLYWARILTTEQPFTVVCENEDVFLRLFTPETPRDPYNTAPPFPNGDISFMHGITPIGTKPLSPERMGPMGQKNIFYTYEKARCKKMSLYFDFSGK